MKERRQEIRNRATLPEKILWNHLKSSKLGYKFRRQHSVGAYVLDFYCATKHVGIELDGEYHLDKDQKDYDVERDLYLKSVGILVLHFTNDQITNSLEKVLLSIQEVLAGIDNEYHTKRPL